MLRGLSRDVDPVSAPFAWETGPDGRRELVGPRVTQCALSRICGACAESLGRPIAFVGDDLEVARNAFHAPPLHEACAEGLAAAEPSFVRPTKDDLDRRPTFQPSALIDG